MVFLYLPTEIVLLRTWSSLSLPSSLTLSILLCSVCFSVCGPPVSLSDQLLLRLINEHLLNLPEKLKCMRKWKRKEWGQMAHFKGGMKWGGKKGEIYKKSQGRWSGEGGGKMAGRIIKAIGERREWNRAALHPSVIWSGNYFHHTSQCQFSLYPSTSGFLSSTRFTPIDLHLCLLSCLLSTCFCHFLLKCLFFN